MKVWKQENETRHPASGVGDKLGQYGLEGKAFAWARVLPVCRRSRDDR